nr:helix-turn-helix domain-containing protein [Carnobacterium maltaromaticum]
MNVFLERISLRKMYLLSLLDSEKRGFSIKELEQKLGHNSKTITKMVQSLKIELAPWQNSITLVTNNDRTLSLKKKASFSLETINLYYLKESFIFKACDAIFNEEFIDIATFSSANYISYSTLYGRLNEIKPLLEHYSIEFKANNMASFEGEEKQIRYFFYHFYWSTHWGMEWPFQKIDKNQFCEIIKRIEGLRKTTTLYISEQESIAFWLGVITTRINLGHTIEQVGLYNSIIDDNSAFTYFKNALLEEFKQLFPTISESDLLNEIQFLYVVMYSNDYFEMDDPQISETLIFSQNRTGEIFGATNHWLKVCSDFFEVSLSAAEYGTIYANLIHLHAEIAFFKGNISVFFNDYLEVSHIQDETNDFYDSLMDYFYQKLIENKKYKKIFINKERLLPRYKMIARKFINIDSQKNSIKVHLISVYGNKKLAYLQNLINRSNEEHLEFSEDYNNVDLIVSDRLYAGISQLNTPMIIWGEEPDENDLAEVNKVIKKISFDKMHKKLVKYTHFPAI